MGRIRRKQSRILTNIKNIPPKTLIGIIVLIILLILIFSIIIVQSSMQKAIIYDGENLNEARYPGYKELIDKLKDEHPNWTFTLYYTKLNWNTVIKHESHSSTRKTPLNLVPDNDSYSGEWAEDDGKKYDNGDWVAASKKAIEYKMDPRNLINENNIFQLKELTYTEEANTAEGIMSKTDGSFLEGKDVAEAIINSSKKNNLDPYFIVSRLLQEQGKKGTKLSQGYEYNGKTVYNPFNISASGNSTSAILENAAKYAYSKEWFSLEKALEEGISFLNTRYIDEGQNTLYFQKFDAIKKGELYKNQYMQNLIAPLSEANILLDQYEESETADSEFNFIIPLYENMPEKISEKPKEE